MWGSMSSDVGLTLAGIWDDTMQLVLYTSLHATCACRTLERRRHKDRVKRISRALNPKNWRLGRGAAAGEQEGLPPPVPPVSGILTLSLQPSQAPANDYTGDVGEGPGTGDSQFKAVHQGQSLMWESVHDTTSIYFITVDSIIN